MISIWHVRSRNTPPAEWYDWRSHGRRYRAENRCPSRCGRPSTRRRGNQVAGIIEVKSDRGVAAERRKMVVDIDPTVPCSASRRSSFAQLLFVDISRRIDRHSGQCEHLGLIGVCGNLEWFTAAPVIKLRRVVGLMKYEKYPNPEPWLDVSWMGVGPEFGGSILRSVGYCPVVY